LRLLSGKLINRRGDGLIGVSRSLQPFFGLVTILQIANIPPPDFDMEAKRTYWYGGMSENAVRGGFSDASDASIGGWDGYYTQVAIDTGVNTVLTIDTDFEQFDAFNTEVILSPAGFAELNRFL